MRKHICDRHIGETSAPCADCDVVRASETNADLHAQIASLKEDRQQLEAALIDSYGVVQEDFKAWKLRPGTRATIAEVQRRRLARTHKEGL